jgi:hypothetical protein
MSYTLDICAFFSPPLFNFFAYPLISWLVHLEVGAPQVGNHWSIVILQEMRELPSSQLVNLELYFEGSKIIKKNYLFINNNSII